MLADIYARIQRRLEKVELSEHAAAKRAGLSADAIRNMGRKVREKAGEGASTATLLALAPVLKTTASWLLEGVGPEELESLYVPIAGYVGADPSGTVQFANGHDTGDRALHPRPGKKWGALLVKGTSMPGFAEHGALVYYDTEHGTPINELLNQVAVIQLPSGEVLIKRLLKGSRPGVYDLESISGPLIPDVSPEWAAEITGIFPPLEAARRIVRRGELPPAHRDTDDSAA